MKWIDILSSAMNSLFRRKLRSALTVLGVVIGTAAIVVTISLGYGAEETQMAALESATNLRLINVSPYYGYNSSGGDVKTTNRITKINDSVISRIRHVAGVDAVTPVVNIWANIEFIIGTDTYQCTTGLTAVQPQDFSKIVELKSGKYLSKSTSQMEFLMSEIAMMEFRDKKQKSEDYEYVDAWSYLMEGKDLPLPNINWLHEKYTLTLQWEDLNDNDANADEDAKIKTKEYKAKFMGVIKTNLNDWTFSNGAVVSIPYIKKLQRDNKALFKEMGVPDMSSYESVYVLAKSVDDVEGVVKGLTELGVQCYSPLEYVNTYKEQIKTVQGFLGFIGAISMMVAALSIANTMMMSIYERTREIGVMKVLGCKMGNIRAMFLTEAAYIGIFGGLLGLLVSYLLSYALNNVEWLQQLVSSVMNTSMSFGGTEGAKTSIIPTSLSLGTWFFVVAISVGSGFYPAQRAMQLSSLEAIRSTN